MEWILTRFILIAPAVGCLGFIFVDQLMSVAGIEVSSLAQTDEVSGLIISIPMLWLYGLVLAYPVGGLPAALSGWIYSWILGKRKSNYNVLLRVVVGGGIGILVSGFTGILFVHSLTTVAPWLVAGVLGGAIGAISIGDDLFSRLSSR